MSLVSFDDLARPPSTIATVIDVADNKSLQLPPRGTVVVLVQVWRTLAVSLPSAEDAVKKKSCDCHERFDMRAQIPSHVGNHRFASEFGAWAVAKRARALAPRFEFLCYLWEVASCDHIYGLCNDLQFVLC